MAIRRYEQVDTAEYAGMFKWFEEATFPDPAGARDTLRRMSLGAYPGAIKAAMAVFDVVESIAVSRTRVCAAGGIHALTRIQVCDGPDVWSMPGAITRPVLFAFINQQQFLSKSQRKAGAAGTGD